MQSMIAREALLALPILGLPVALYLYLLFRLSAFRKDRASTGSYFGLPYLAMHRVLTRSNYLPEGQRLLPWLVASMVLCGIAMGWALLRLYSA